MTTGEGSRIVATSIVKLIEETFLQGLLPGKVVVLGVLDVVGPQIVEGGARRGCKEESKVMGRKKSVAVLPESYISGVQ